MRVRVAAVLFAMSCSEAPNVAPPPDEAPVRDGGVTPEHEEAARLFFASSAVRPVATFELGRPDETLELLPARPQDYGIFGRASFRKMEATPDGTRVVAHIRGDDDHLVVFDATTPQDEPVTLHTGSVQSWSVVSNDYVVWRQAMGADPENGTYLRRLAADAPARFLSRTLRSAAILGGHVLLADADGALVAHRIEDGEERTLSSLTQRFELPVFVVDDRFVIRRNAALVAYDIATLTSTVVADAGRCPEPVGAIHGDEEFLCLAGGTIEAYRLDGSAPSLPRIVASDVTSAKLSSDRLWLWSVGLDATLARRSSGTGVATATSALAAGEVLEAVSSDGRHAVLRGPERDAVIDSEGARRFSAEITPQSWYPGALYGFDPSSRYFLYDDPEPHALDLETGEVHRLRARVSTFAARGAVGDIVSEGLRLYRSEGGAPAEALGPWHPTTLYPPVVHAGHVITDRRHEGVWKTAVDGTSTRLAEEGAFDGMLVVGDFVVGIVRNTGRVEAFALDGMGASERWEVLTSFARTGGRHLALWWTRGVSIVEVDGIEEEPVEFLVTDATVDDVRWSSAIERFVVSITTDTGTRIVALDVDGASSELATLPRFANPTLVLTETHAFVTRYRGAPGTWSVPLDGGDARQVSEAGRLERVFFESNRALIVDSDAVELVDLDTLAAETVVSASAFTLGAASRDDARQAFVADGALHAVTWSPLHVARVGEGLESLGFTIDGRGLYHVDVIGKLSVFEVALDRSRALTEGGVRIDHVDPVDAETLIVRVLDDGEPGLHLLDDGRLRPILEVPDAEERYLPIE